MGIYDPKKPKIKPRWSVKITLTLEECVEKYGPVKGPIIWQDQFPDWPIPDVKLDHSLDPDEDQ